MYEYSLEEYKELFADICRQKGVKPENVWNNYHSRVEFALDLIPSFKIGDKKATSKEIRIALGVKADEWYVMKRTFERLNEALNADKSIMKFKAQLALLKGVKETENKNAKMIEMMLKRFDDEYNKKDEIEVELPKTLNIQVHDARLDDKERKEKAHVQIDK